MTTVTREHLAGLQAALDLANEHWPPTPLIEDLESLIAQASAAPEQEAVAFRCKLSIHRDWKYIDHRSPDSYELRECQIEMLYTHPSAEIERLRAEVERLYMQLTACGVVAMANTHQSAAEARDMHPDYNSVACRDVMRAVDREINLRDQLAEAQALLRELDNAWNSHDGKETFGMLMKKVELLSATAQPPQCSPCGGWGRIAAEPGDAETQCEHCNGTGKPAEVKS